MSGGEGSGRGSESRVVVWRGLGNDVVFLVVIVVVVVVVVNRDSRNTLQD